MDKVERILIWLGHILMATAASSLFYLDSLPDPNLGTAVFITSVCCYTFGLSISIYLDKTVAERQAKLKASDSMGPLLKPTLLACLCTVISISIVVVIISEYAEGLGVI